MARYNNNSNNNYNHKSGGGGEASSARADLLNFHFSTSPPAPNRNNNNNQNRRNNNNHNNHNQHQHGNNRQTKNNKKKNKNNKNNNNKNKDYEKNSQNWSSARRRSAATMFYLHSSADHAFVVTRNGFHLQEYSFSGCDEPVSWESVRVVKQLVPAPAPTSNNSNNKLNQYQHEQNYHNCPICLDSFLSPRITKCGHAFCYPCILRHVQSQAENNPYKHVKCPCCGIPLHVQDLRPVLPQNCLYPQPKEKQTIRLQKLHRTKDCPAPYLPLPDSPRRSSPHAAPCTNDVDATYSRFNYIDYDVYQQHLEENRKALEKRLESLKRHRNTTTTKTTTTTNRKNTNVNNNNTNANNQPASVYHLQSQRRRQQQQQQQQQQQRASPHNNNKNQRNNNSNTNNKAPVAYYTDEVEAFFINLSLETIRKEMLKAIEEAEEEKALVERFSAPTSGMYQTHPKYLLASHYQAFLEEEEKRKKNSLAEQEIMFSMDNDNDNSNIINNNNNDSNNVDASGHHGSDNNRITGDDGGGGGEEEVIPPKSATTTATDATTMATETAGEMTTAAATTMIMTSDSNPDPSSAPEHETDRDGQQRNFRNRSNSSSFIDSESSMYLDEGSYHFYQSTDGQLCFLSGFNMNCLLSDYSSFVPDKEQLRSMLRSSQSSSSSLKEEEENEILLQKMMARRPLPDTIEGTILEVDSFHVTHETRKRFPFLSHLPLHIDIAFVELDLRRFLTHETKQKFRSEFEKRRKRRMSKVYAEKRADSIAKRKEQRRIDELKARMQYTPIDPNDDFFRYSATTSFFPEEDIPPSGESFGPAISEATTEQQERQEGNTDNNNNNNAGTTSTNTTTSVPQQSSNNNTISFSRVCKTGGVYGSAVTRADLNFPALGSPKQQQKKQQQQPQQHFPSLPVVSPPPQRSSSSGTAASIVSGGGANWGSNSSGKSASSTTATNTVAPSSSWGSHNNNNNNNSPTKKKGKGGKKKIVLFSTGGHRGTSY